MAIRLGKSAALAMAAALLVAAKMPPVWAVEKSKEQRTDVGPQTVIAEVNGEKIIRADIEFGLAKIKSSTAMGLSPKANAKALVEGQVKEAVDKALIRQEAVRRGLLESPAYTVPLKLIRDFYLGEAFMLDKVDKVVEPKESEIKAAYPKEWTQIRARIIHFSSQEEAEAAHPDIVKNKDKFDEMYLKYNIMTSQRKGEIGPFFPNSGYFSPDDDALIFSLNKGDISPVLDMQISWGVLLILDKIPWQEKDIEQFRQSIRANLRDKKTTEYLRVLAEKHVFEYKAAVLDDCIEDELALKRTNPVVAVIDGMEVRFLDLRNYFTRLPETVLNNVSAVTLSAAYGGEIQQLFVARQMADEARRLGFEQQSVPPIQINREEGLLQKVLADALLENVSITEAEVREHYEKNIKMFYSADAYELAKILLSDEKMAATVYDSIRNQRHHFESAALQVSEDPSKEKGGHIGLVDLSFLPEDHRKVLTATPEGEITPPLKMGDKFVLYKVIKIKKDYFSPYESVRWSIVRVLLTKKFGSVLGPFLDGLRAKSKVQMNSQAVEALAQELQKSKNPLKTGGGHMQ